MSYWNDQCALTSFEPQLCTADVTSTLAPVLKKRSFSSVALLKLALTMSKGTLTTTCGEYSAGWLSV